MGISLAQQYDSEVIFIMSDGEVVVSDGIIYNTDEKIITIK